MKNSSHNPIIVLTDKVSGALNNGSEIMASAVLRALGQWFQLEIIVRTKEEVPDDFPAQVITFDEDSDDLGEALSAILQKYESDFGIIYNLGGTVYSSKLAAMLSHIAPQLVVINHFQLVLPVYAQYAGYSQVEANEIGLHARYLAERAHCNIFVSSSELNLAHRLGWNIWGLNNIVIPNPFIPVEPAPFEEKDPNRWNFFAAGRFSDFAKGSDLLFRAFRRYYQENPTAHLFIACDEARFLDLLNDLPTSAWSYLGWLSRAKLLAHLRAADIAIVPSRYEPFGMIAVEAMAMGTPVIAMATGGLAEIIHHEETGWLSDPKEGSQGLLKVLREATTNKEHLGKISSNAIDEVQRLYKLEGIVKQIKKVLDNAFALASLNMHRVS